MRSLNKETLELIQEYEGCVLHVYKDVAGLPTIGIGHLILPGEDFSQGISLDQAHALFETDSMKAKQAVLKLVHVPLTDNQYGALVSFTFNVGEGALGRSTLLQKLNQQDYQGAAQEFQKWVRAGGKKVKGLVRRRLAEQALFLS